MIVTVRVCDDERVGGVDAGNGGDNDGGESGADGGGDADAVDADDDDYVYFRMLCPAACNRK